MSCFVLICSYYRWTTVSLQWKTLSIAYLDSHQVSRKFDALSPPRQQKNIPANIKDPTASITHITAMMICSPFLDACLNSNEVRICKWGLRFQTSGIRSCSWTYLCFVYEIMKTEFDHVVYINGVEIFNFWTFNSTSFRNISFYLP